MTKYHYVQETKYKAINRLTLETEGIFNRKNEALKFFNSINSVKKGVIIIKKITKKYKWQCRNENIPYCSLVSTKEKTIAE